MWGHNDHEKMNTFVTECHYFVIKMQRYSKGPNGDLFYKIIQSYTFVSKMWGHIDPEKANTFVTKCHYDVIQMESYIKEPNEDLCY